MNDPVRDSLQRLLRERPGLQERPRVLEACLRDLHPERPAQVAAALEALRAGVVTALAQRPAPDHETLARQLRLASGLTPGLSWWAVAAWQQVLELGEAPEPPPSVSDSSGAAAPQAPPRRLGEVLDAALLLLKEPS